MGIFVRQPEFPMELQFCSYTRLLNRKRGLKTKNLKMPVIIVGCVIILLILVNGIKWISKPVKKAHIITNTMEDNDLPTVYTEIDERSERESESNTMRTTVTSTSFTSLNGIETRRPQLPVRNTQLNFFYRDYGFCDNKTIYCIHTCILQCISYHIAYIWYELFIN